MSGSKDQWQLTRAVQRQAVAGIERAIINLQRHHEMLGVRVGNRAAGAISTVEDARSATVVELRNVALLWAVYERGWRDHAWASPTSPPPPVDQRLAPGPISGTQMGRFNRTQEHAYLQTYEYFNPFCIHRSDLYPCVYTFKTLYRY